MVNNKRKVKFTFDSNKKRKSNKRIFNFPDYDFLSKKIENVEVKLHNANNIFNCSLEDDILTSYYLKYKDETCNVKYSDEYPNLMKLVLNESYTDYIALYTIGCVNGNGILFNKENTDRLKELVQLMDSINEFVNLNLEVKLIKVSKSVVQVANENFYCNYTNEVDFVYKYLDGFINKLANKMTFKNNSEYYIMDYRLAFTLKF
jgi:hypothetical protein